MVKLSEGREFYDDGYDDNDDSDLPDQLNISPENFCGRGKELKLLQDLYRSHMEVSTSDVGRLGKSPIALISGESGCGKSGLVDQFVRWVEKELKPLGGHQFFYISGKHDALAREPYSALVSAYGSLGSSLKNSKDCEEAMKQLRDRISRTLGDEIDALLAFVPGLSDVMGRKSNHEYTACNEETAPNRIRYLLHLLNVAVCLGGKPLILFLDDLQWMDDASLAFISQWLKDRSARKFMLVGAYRLNEVGTSHAFEDFLVQAKKKDYDILTIRLPNLSSQEVQEFIAKVLNLDEDDDTQVLAKAICGKTNGNVLFVIQALEELQRKNVLYYSNITFSWEWNEKGLEQIESQVSSQVQDAIADKIHGLPNEVQDALAVASYTRSMLDRSTLLELLKSDEKRICVEELVKRLDVAVQQGVLKRCSAGQRYSFGHDKFQEVAQSLVQPGPDTQNLKYRIGSKLYELASSKKEDDSDWMVFVAADHLNSIPFPDDRLVFLAEVNLSSGELSVALADFKRAEHYFQRGVEAIKKVPRRWTHHYDVTLRLYRGLSDTMVCIGDFEVGREYGVEVFKNAVSLVDKVPTFLSWSRAFGRLGSHEEAYGVCRTALALDTTIGYPRFGYYFRTWWILAWVNLYLNHHSDTEILSLPTMTDESILSTVALYDELTLRALILGRQIEFCFGFSRQMQLMIRYGLCKYSPAVFAAYAMYLFATEQPAAAARVSRLARLMTERIKDKGREGLTILTTSLIVEDWHCPRNLVLMELEKARNSAMVVGDIETGFACWYNMTLQSFLIGDPLGPIETEARRRLQRMKLYKTDTPVHILEQTLFPILALTDHLEKEIDWESSDTRRGNTKNEFQRYRLIHRCIGRMAVGVHFRRFKTTIEAARVLPSEKSDGYSSYVPPLFYLGLAHAGLARQPGNYKHARKLRKVVKQMRHLVKTVCPKKMLNKLRLLEAELASTQGVATKKVKPMYDAAISLSLEADNLQDATLANEFAADYFHGRGDFGLAGIYFTQAKDLCEKWGAWAKCKDLNRRQGDYLQRRNEP